MNKSNTYAGLLASTIKKLVPKTLFNFLKVNYYIFKAKNSINSFKNQKKSYLDYYANYINKKAHSFEINDELINMGSYDLKLLKNLGLKKNNSLYEFGVGYLRSANQFVQYLDINKFGGNDASSERIERGKKLFPIMKKKKAQLFATSDNSFDWLKGKKYDYLFSNAVFCHMPLEDIKEVLENVYKKVMHKYSKFIFSYSVLEFKNYRGFEKHSYVEAKNKANQYLTNKDLMQLYKIKEKAQKEELVQTDFCNWFHSKKLIENLVSEIGFKYKDVTDFLDKNAKEHYNAWERTILISK